MAKKITLAQLDIDIDALTKKSAEYLGQITTIKGEQKALRKSTDNLNKASKEELTTYTQKEVELKKLQTSYNQQKNILAEVSTGVKNLSETLNNEVKSVKDAQRNNSKLIKIRNQVNVKTREGQKAISQINEKITKNNILIRKNSSALEKQRLNIGNYGIALRGIGSVLRSAGLVGGVAGLVLAFKGLFNIVSEFQSGVSNLAAVLDKPISQIKELTENAIKLGASTAKTATEVLGLQEAYARLGFKQKEIIDLTKPTINASVALNSSLEDTANLAGAVVNSFDELSTADAPLILDQITASTQNSALTFEKLQTGIPNVAAAASAAGVPFSKLLSLLGKLADSGIDASKSSTSLRNIFIESAAAGLSYEEILEKIKGSQDKLTNATDEFGKRAAVSAIALAKNIDSTKELDLVIQGAAGTAQRAADTQLNNLKGAITLLGSAFDGFILSIDNGTGSASTFLKSIIDSTTAMFGFLTPTNQVSEGLKDQRNEINSLVSQLGNLNITEENRIKITNRLNQIAPELVSTLNNQGVATDKTRLALDKLNNSFIANIALQIKAEEITEVATKEAEARLVFFEKEARVVEQIAKIRRLGTNVQKQLIDQGQKQGKTNLEIASSLIKVADKSSETNSQMSRGGRILDSNVSILQEYSNGLKVSEVVLGQAEGATSLLRKETEKLKQSFIDTGYLANDIIPDKEKIEESTDSLNRQVFAAIKLSKELKGIRNNQDNDIINDKKFLESTLKDIEYKSREETNAAEEEDREEKLASIQNWTSQVSSVLNGFMRNNLARANQEADASIMAINRRYESEFARAGENADRIQFLEKQKEAEISRIEAVRREKQIKNAKNQKKLAIAESIIAGALAVVKSLPNVFAALATGRNLQKALKELRVQEHQRVIQYLLGIVKMKE
jgi:hypothetical protein